MGIAHFTFLILTVWGGGMTSQDWWQKFIFFNWQNGFSGFEGPFGNRIESEKKFKKLILFKRYEALKCHIFLKIITKIAEF